MRTSYRYDMNKDTIIVQVECLGDDDGPLVGICIQDPDEQNRLGIRIRTAEQARRIREIAELAELKYLRAKREYDIAHPFKSKLTLSDAEVILAPEYELCQRVGPDDRREADRLHENLGRRKGDTEKKQEPPALWGDIDPDATLNEGDLKDFGRK